MAPQKSAVKLGRTACLLVFLALLVGYLVIFYSVFRSAVGSGGTSAGEESRLQLEVETLQRLVSAKNVELDRLRNQVKSQATAQRHKQGRAAAGDASTPVAPSLPPAAPSLPATRAHELYPASRPGVIILGMHRSGTSVIGGLMHQMGLQVGGPLIGPAADNAKGFFERVDVVLQNDYLMRKQQVHYALNTQSYDGALGLKHALEGLDTQWFAEGRRGLAFLNDAKSSPWMLKDPRLCITLRTWLGLLKGSPAVLFAYRHPLDVALSLNKREQEHFKIARGLKMWYVYNMRAVQNSADLCRVVASHKAVMAEPQAELDRIRAQLAVCGVEAPHRATAAQIGTFIDASLMHGRTTLADKSCPIDPAAPLLPPASWPTQDAEHIDLYREAMRVYCAMEDGSAFRPAFAWRTDMQDA